MKVAIIGSGISGLSAAYLLAKKNRNGEEKFEVEIFEAGETLGGHTNTVLVAPLEGSERAAAADSAANASSNESDEVRRERPARASIVGLEQLDGNGNPIESSSSFVGVDTGFIVCNPVTYPNFLAMMEDLEVPMADSNMSFAVSRDRGAFEWAGKNLSSVFCQTKNLFNPSMYRMIYEIVCFNRQATRLAEQMDSLQFDQMGKALPNASENIQDHPLSKQTMGQFFQEHGYSLFFYENYILPMTAAIWSSPADLAFEHFPMLTLIRFMRNHCLLQVGRRPVWRTVANGSASYIPAILANVDPSLIHTNTKIIRVQRPSNFTDPILLTDQNGQVYECDHLIFATHSDQALEILGNEASELEREILGDIKYSVNTAVLHRDINLMPKNEVAWSAWNYLTTAKFESKSTSMCLSYWMNKLQPWIDPSIYGQVIVTLNPHFPPNPATVLGSWSYTHPMYTQDLVKAQDRLPEIQNSSTRRTLFCGAWTNYGFHEDGCTSGLLAAVSLGAECPAFHISLNGGYPTTRESINPPKHLAASSKGRGQGGVEKYLVKSPKYLGFRESSSSSGHFLDSLFLLVLPVVVFAAIASF